MKFTQSLAAAAIATLLLAAPQPLQAQASQFTDARISAVVESRLYTSRQGRFHRVDAETRNGNVRLYGSVDNLLARAMAEDIVSSTRGVRDVRNEITVNAPTRTNKKIATDIEAVLSADPATRSLETRIAVADGLVVLTGTAETQQEKQLVESLAAGILGVRRIQNSIKITYREETTDQQIKADIDARMQAVSSIDHSNIGVAVSNGNVELSGRVGSAKERKVAENIAWVSGTRDVDKARLQVVAEPGDLPRRTTKVSDQQIANAVKTAMKYNPRVKSANVSVAALNSVVTLTGTVPSLTAKNSAEDDADNVYGVRDVRNLLRVRANDEITDEEMEAAARLALARDPYVDRSEISVRVSNRHAHLRGEADSDTERRRAYEVVSAVKGVVFVSDHLKVAEPRTTKSDWAIQQSIAEQMLWSPFIDRREVTIDVDKGVVTLNGTVDTWNERRAAAKNAYDGGAVRVDNRLSVKLDPGLEDILQ